MYRIAGCLKGCDYVSVDRMLKAMTKGNSGHKRIQRLDNAVLGYYKLINGDSIGHEQPLFNEDRSVVGVFDGELYNYKEIKSRLFQRGHRFNTDNEGELLVHLYEELGPKMLSEIDGVFTFVIVEQKGFFMARDVLGIRPLYFCEDKENGSMYFASEIKALLKITDDIKEFPKGYYYTDREGFVQYDKIDLLELKETNSDEIIDEIDKRLNEAVRKRIRPDDKVGVFLSGGLDSSLVAAIARQYVRGEFHSFSVGLPGSEDLYYSKMVAEHLNTIHHFEEYTEEDVVKILPKVIYHLESFDPALVRGSVATYFAARLASKYVRLVLIGEGADELFGGYEYLKRSLDNDDLNTELLNLVNSLHNTSLQRVDRITAANNLTVRAPFLDKDVVRYALSLKGEHKIYGEDKIEKWILRKVAEKYLPKEVVWRKKSKIAHGTGTSKVLSEWARKQVRMKKERLNNVPLEEWVYFNIFRELFPRLRNLEIIGKTRSIVPEEIA